jgi:hypothetical protein
MQAHCTGYDEGLMRLAIILVVIWLLVSAFWAQFIYGAWHQAVDPNNALIAAFDRCNTLFPPRADGYASEAGNSWSVWEANVAQTHPECAPAVGSVGFLEFVALNSQQRTDIRQKAESENSSVTKGAIVAGAAGPPVLFLVGLMTIFLVRAYRSR